jgi:arylsulfatase A-like enzyme
MRRVMRADGKMGGRYRGLLVWTAGIVLVGVALLGLFRGSPALSRVRPWARATILSKLDALPEPSPGPEPRLAERKAYRALASGDGLRSNGEISTVRLLETVGTIDGSTGIERLAVSLDGQTRNALAGIVPFRFKAHVRVPGQAELWLALDHEGAGLDGGGVEFRICVSAAGSTSLVLQQTLSALQTQWREARVDLGHWAGQEIEIELEATHAAGGEDSSRGGPPANPITAYWGDLFLHPRELDRSRPNLVVLLIDTLRRDHVSAYGYGRPTTPQIDALAAEGVRFDSAISNAPWTDPAVLALFTGVYPSDLWQPAPWAEAIKRALPEQPATLAQLLARAGYFTIAASDHPGISASRFGRGFDVFADLYHADGPYSWRKTEPAKLLAQVGELLRGRAGGGVLAYIHLLYPHTPYAPPPDYLALLGLRPSAESSGTQASIERYDAEVRLSDDVVGFIRRLLIEEGLASDAVTVVLSDHGEAFAEHGLVEHGNSLYNELLRIPLIIHAPGRLPGGGVVEPTVELVDVLPTLLDLVGLPAPVQARGASLRPLIEGRSAPERAAYSELPHSRIVAGYCIQSQSLKLIASTGGATPAERYDLLADPGELSPGRGSTGAEAALARRAQEIRAEARRRRAGLGTSPSVPSESTLQRLRALGYLR